MSEYDAADRLLHPDDHVKAENLRVEVEPATGLTEDMDAGAAVERALREAAKKWRPFIADQRCPTCQMGRSRETVGMVCQTCGTDYAALAGTEETR